ncbi:hypothetical protein Taro_041558 [Colocasia esculenta]|uniref:Uncharacterized protein n=1 Tax=Colocasia esculenta TaxID=4460 RepID=A0A843WM05_COLES|nr:hypothetical protein [Colocasia esculenta]
MQLRPSMAHIDACGLNRKKHGAQSAGVTNPGDEKAEASKKPSVSQGKEIAEATNENGLDFTRIPCSGFSYLKWIEEENGVRRGRSYSFLDEPGPHVHRLDALLHLAPSESVDDVLKNITIANSKLKEIKIPMEGLKRILSPLAFERSICNDWKFKEPTDFTFIKRHPEIVKMQESLWSRHQEHITDALRGLVRNPLAATKGSTKLGSGVKATSICSVDQNPKRGNEAIVSPGSSTMSDEILEALPKALTELFRNHKVCSMNRIRQGLREMAVSKSTLPKADPRIFVLAAHGAAAPVSELEPIICKVAEKIHDVYVPKSSSNPALNPLRNVVINLLRGKPRTEKLKKGDIVAAVEMVIGKTFSASDYSQVLNELCVSNRGAGWLLKSGDEMPN